MILYFTKQSHFNSSTHNNIIWTFQLITVTTNNKTQDLFQICQSSIFHHETRLFFQKRNYFEFKSSEFSHCQKFQFSALCDRYIQSNWHDDVALSGCHHLVISFGDKLENSSVLLIYKVVCHMTHTCNKCLASNPIQF